ncbi:hypothetical protein BH09ACT7_BH09ACT7_50900 [soil metagenome]
MLRRAVTADLPAIRTAVDEAYSPYIERIGKPPAPMTADYAALLESSRVWVIECGTTVVGLLVTQRRGDHLLLENVAVAPGTQGSGYGTLLLKRAEPDAVEQGLAEVRLYTNAAMTENLTYIRGTVIARRAAPPRTAFTACSTPNRSTHLQTRRYGPNQQHRPRFAHYGVGNTTRGGVARVRLRKGDKVMRQSVRKFSGGR